MTAFKWNSFRIHYYRMRYKALECLQFVSVSCQLQRYTNSKYFIAPDNKITMKLNCKLQNQPERLAAIYSSHKHGPHWFNIDTGSSFSSASVTFKIRCFLSSVLFPAFSMSWLRENRHSYMSKYKFTHFVEANLPCWSLNTAFDNWHSRVCKTVVVSTSGSLIRLT